MQVVDELWRNPSATPYPEARMQRLLKVVDVALLQGVQEQLSMLDLWTAEFVTVS